MNQDIGNNVSDIFQSNRLLITNFIMKNENITRTKLSESTGLTLASISKIVKKLVDKKIILENKYIKGKSGRRSIGLMFNYDLYHVIGVKLSRRYFIVTICDFSGEIIKEEKINFERESASEIMNKLINRINQFVEKDSKIVATGVAVPGPYNEKNGRIELITTLTDFHNINIEKILNDNLNIPVFIWLDANAAVLAVKSELEEKYGSTLEDVAFYYIDQGVGAGIISGNHIISGSNGTAGEIGHISIKYDGYKCSCGNYGCLEMYCSSLSFVENVKKNLEYNQNSSLFNEKIIELNTVFDHARKGDDYSLECVDELANYIAYGAINIINGYDTSILFLDGEIMLGKDLFQSRVLEVINSRLMDNMLKNLTIKFSNYNKDYVLSGATLMAIEEIMMQSNFFK